MIIKVMKAKDKNPTVIHMERFGPSKLYATASIQISKYKKIVNLKYKKSSVKHMKLPENDLKSCLHPH